MLEELFEIQTGLARYTSLAFKRYLYPEINWNTRLLGIVGPRGVGKTTFLLQYYKEFFDSPKQCLYLTADHVLVASQGLYVIAKEFFKLGGEVLIADEIHKYKNWSQELKNIYDSFPEKRVIVSGSSSLDILKGKYDLSRRMVIYSLKGLSLREYFNLETSQAIPPLRLDQIIKEHVGLSTQIISKEPITKYFHDYLKHGYYPFYLEGPDHYASKLENAIEKILYEDIPSVFDIKPSSISFLKKMIYAVATSPPFVPNIEKMSSQFGLSKEYVYHYLEYLEKAGLFAFLKPSGEGLKVARKPEKIYLENTNILHNIIGKYGFRSEIGAVRESFFLNQVSLKHAVSSATQGDFKVDNHYTFEVGGKAKDKKQIYHIPDSYIIADDVEIGSGHKIPLWIFGFLY